MVTIGGAGTDPEDEGERRRDGVLVLSVWREAAPPGGRDAVRYRVLCDPVLTDRAPAGPVATHWVATADEALDAVRRWLRTVG